MKNNAKDVIALIASGYVCYLSVQIITTVQEEQPSNETFLTFVAVVMLLAGLVFVLIYGKSLFMDFKGRKGKKEDIENVDKEDEATKDTEWIDTSDDSVDRDTADQDTADHDSVDQDTVKIPKSIFGKIKK